VVDSAVAWQTETRCPLFKGSRRREPTAQSWIAYEAIAARQLGTARYGELFNYDRFVRQYRLGSAARLVLHGGA